MPIWFARYSRVLDVIELGLATRGQVSIAVRRLKRVIMSTPPKSARSRRAVPALSPESLRAALASLPAADAYLVRRVHLEGESVVALAGVWGIEPSGLELRLRETMAALRSSGDCLLVDR
jgi:hypothetical protein